MQNKLMAEESLDKLGFKNVAGGAGSAAPTK